MIIKIINYSGDVFLRECDSFEFRTNQVSNWVKVIKGETTEYIHGISVIKSLREDP